jgi:acetate kinase
MRVVVLNPGSSSLKAALIELPETTLARAQVPWDVDPAHGGGRGKGVELALRELGLDGQRDPAVHVDAVGYRVVHGGPGLTSARVIDDEVTARIASAAHLAPLHNDVALETISAGRGLLPGVPHVACFDTAFHATLPAEAYRYPVPEHWFAEWGVRRYGFHGLSVLWSVRRAATLLERNVADLSLVVAHLGGGCSVTAVVDGRSVETSMGLTPLEGLMMGTRSGSIDPGLTFYLLARTPLTVEAIGEALEHASGLLGVSGSSADLRELEARAAGGDERAALAMAMFVRRAAAWIAAVATSLPRLDALVFTGGIGEGAAAVRARIVERLGVLGIGPLTRPPAVGQVDGRLNDGSDPVAVLRIEAREDLVIAAEAAAAIG